MQAELLRNEMEILEKLADRKLSGIPKAYRIFEENREVYLIREYIEGTPLAQMVLQNQQEDMQDSRAVSESG